MCTILKRLSVASAVPLILALAAQVEADVMTVGVYDENTVETNTVDVSATSDTGNEVSLSTFTANVLAAFNQDLGGVIDFDNGTVDAGQIVATYGVNQSKSITITNGEGSGIWSNGPVGSNRTAISDGNIMGVGGLTASHYDFRFDLNDLVVQAGATVISRGGSSDVPYTVTATFKDIGGNDAGTATVDFTSNSTNGEGDTFAGFKAPAGAFITQLRFNANATAGRQVDDLAFVTVPEPASLALLGLGGLMILRRRSRLLRPRHS